MNPTESNTDPKLHRILVIDDEEIVLVGLRETLAREGHQVVTASNPFLALQELQKQPFSVIISDHHMPGVTGLEFLAQAKEIQPDATRILITAVLSLDTVIDAINHGEIYRFIVKPWLREELLATVKSAVQRYDLIRRNSALQAEAIALNQQFMGLNKSLELQMARVAEQNQNLLKLNEALAENLQHSVQLGLHVLQTFHPALGNQAWRVHEVCRAMADTLNLSIEKRQALGFSAWLHDIGLIGIHRDIIQRLEENPDSLSPSEKTLLQSHPILGQDLVQFGHHLEEVGVIIRAHHERFDGTGFPDQLKGEAIPWLSRLLAVAVGFAEFNGEDDNAVEAVKLSSGTAYDPDAVRAFLRALPKATVPRKEREVLLAELAPGMVLAKGIYTANGLLLIPEGQPLCESSINKIQNHNRVDPISQALLVYC
ncbi:MAG: response regulator [Verrucomicrobia subdivision 3 bacterium]|nr:response regulator [Verrucomicrobiota bacterium]MCC6823431.1 response regulator [Limisphaerales bacterium]